MQDAEPIPAGEFEGWLSSFLESLRGKHPIEVPCGTCIGCCTSGHFVHVLPSETRTLAVIPPKHLAKAPGMPAGHKLLGFDRNGHCPMLKDRSCSIYPHRPATCRDFDCRVLAAAGLVETGTWSERINARVRAWKFDYAKPESAARHAAVKAAARFIRSNSNLFPGGRIPARPLDLAVLVAKVHQVFLRNTTTVEPQTLAEAVVQESRSFAAPNAA